MLKKLHPAILIRVLLTLACGILLMIFPSTGARTLSTITGAAMACSGLALAAWSVLRKKEGTCRMAQGLMMLFCGLFMLLHSEMFSILIPYLLALGTLGMGCMSLQEAFLEKRRGGSRVMWHLLSGGVTAAFAILLLLIPFADPALHYMLIGVALTVCAALSILAHYVRFPGKAKEAG